MCCEVCQKSDQHKISAYWLGDWPSSRISGSAMLKIFRYSHIFSSRKMQGSQAMINLVLSPLYVYMLFSPKFEAEITYAFQTTKTGKKRRFFSFHSH
jgi:hypothetical protein